MYVTIHMYIMRLEIILCNYNIFFKTYKEIIWQHWHIQITNITAIHMIIAIAPITIPAITPVDSNELSLVVDVSSPVSKELKESK